MKEFWQRIILKCLYSLWKSRGPLPWKIKKVKGEAKLPQKAFATDAGWDLFAAEDVDIPYGEIRKVDTGISGRIPNGHCGLILDRSSIGSKGIFKTAGLIDQNYTGPIKVCLMNFCKDCGTYSIKVGDKIAQMLILPVVPIEIEEVDSLEETDRSNGGFGSTGAR